jgi:hypothetical protein
MEPRLAAFLDEAGEVVEDGVTGWLCEPNDLGSIEQALGRLAMASPDELRALGASAARRVADAHDGPEMLSRMIELLRAVARGSHSSWLHRPLPTGLDPSLGAARWRGWLGRLCFGAGGPRR